MNMDNSSSGNSIQLLEFMLNDVYACIDINIINKALPFPLLEVVPGSQRYLAGLMNYAGESIPIIDLAMRLKLERSESYSLDTPILLCSHENKKMGIIVDKIIGLSHVAQDSLQMNNHFISPNSPILGSVVIGSKISLLIDIEYIMRKYFSLVILKTKQDNFLSDSSGMKS